MAPKNIWLAYPSPSHSKSLFKDIHLLAVMSSPLRRHTKRFSGSVKNLVYRLYPQGVSSPQLIDSAGTRQTDEDYCNAGYLFSNNREDFCLNGARCYSTNDGPKCDCAFTDYAGPKCDRGMDFGLGLGFGLFFSLGFICLC